MPELLSPVRVGQGLHSVALVLPIFLFSQPCLHTHPPEKPPARIPPPQRRKAALYLGALPGCHLPGIAVIAGKDPQLVTVHCGAMG